EDGQVDVDEELGIDAPRHGVVTGGHAEVIDALRHLARDTCLAQGTRRPGGAPELVVVGAGIVDRVVEPEGDPDLGGALALPPSRPRGAPGIRAGGGGRGSAETWPSRPPATRSSGAAAPDERAPARRGPSCGREPRH